MSERYVIPADIDFADLKLGVGIDGKIEFDRQPLERICRESGIDPSVPFSSVSRLVHLIVAWYKQHRRLGGSPDAVVEPLYAESEAMPDPMLVESVRAIDPDALARTFDPDIPDVCLDGQTAVTASEAAALVGQTRQAIAYWQRCGYLTPIAGSSPAKYRKADVLAAANREVKAGRPRKG